MYITSKHLGPESRGKFWAWFHGQLGETKPSSGYLRIGRAPVASVAGKKLKKLYDFHLIKHGNVWQFAMAMGSFAIMGNSSMTGWWFQPLWKILVSWDYYSQHMGKNVPKHQPDEDFPLPSLWPGKCGHCFMARTAPPPGPGSPLVPSAESPRSARCSNMAEWCCILDDYPLVIKRGSGKSAKKTYKWN